MARIKKKKLKGRKYKTITFKLTMKQKKSLDKFSKARNITPLKLIKRSIADFISLPEDAPPPKSYPTVNQLDLFTEAELAAENVEDYLGDKT